MALIASSVTAINDVPFPPPVNESQIEAMIGRLGDSGMSAIAYALQHDPEQTTEVSTDSLGNSAGTPT